MRGAGSFDLKASLPVAELMLATATLCWGGNMLVGRALRDAIDPLTLNTLRWSLALLVLLPFTANTLWAHRGTLRRHWKILCGLGLSGIAGFHLFQYAALQATSATNVAILIATAPLVIALLSWLLLGEPATRRLLVGACVSIIGAVIVITDGEVQRLLSLDVARGDLFQLVAVPLWSLYAVLLKRRPPELPPLALIAATIIPALVVSLPLLLVMPLRLEPGPEVLLGLFYVAFLASVLAYICWNAGTRMVGPNRAGLFLNLIPLFGALLAIVFLGERILPYHLVAAALIVFAIWFVRSGAPRTRTAARERVR